MNLKLAVFIIVDVIIILLLFIQLRYTMSTPQGFSRLQQMRTSFLQRLNLAMSDIKAEQESKKKLLRFKVKEAKTLNDRIAKYIAKAPSSKDNLGHKVSTFESWLEVALQPQRLIKIKHEWLMKLSTNKMPLIPLTDV